MLLSRYWLKCAEKQDETSKEVIVGRARLETSASYFIAASFIYASLKFHSTPTPTKFGNEDKVNF